MNGPIDTLGYLLLGFGVIFGVLFLHLWSLRARVRSLNTDLEMLEEIKQGK
jgi:hypothetical protein